MGRLHLFEFEDFDWFPHTLRRYLTDYLRTVESLAATKLRGFVPLLTRLIDAKGSARVVDLCSGSGGPWPILQPALAEAGRPVEVVLTDIAPSPSSIDSAEAGHPGLHYRHEPVDATAVPAELSGPRVIFNGLHHFRPEAARRIVADAMQKGEGIAVFEVISRRPAHVLTFPFIFLAVLLITPLIRPFSWGRLLWTYLIPLVPLLVMWDGVVSALRVYSQDELRALVDGLSVENYTWEIGEIASVGPPAPYLLGLPTATATAEA